MDEQSRRAPIPPVGVMNPGADLRERCQRLIYAVFTHENRKPVRLEINRSELEAAVRAAHLMTTSPARPLAQFMGHPATETDGLSVIYFTPVVGLPDDYELPY